MTNQFPDATKMVLSPAAQAVLDAALDADFCIEFTDLEATMKASVQRVAAAALRAAADQVVPATLFSLRHITDDVWDAREDVRAKLLAIAAELEGIKKQ
jgi:hypothetical protein